jgi:hypothetical protein
MNKKEIKENLSNGLSMILLSEGFKLNKKESDWKFEKVTDFGFNKIYILVWHYPPTYFASIYLSIRVDEIDNLYNKFSDTSPDYYNQTNTIGAGLIDIGLKEDKFKIETKEDLDRTTILFSDIINNYFKDFISRFKSSQTIDKELNRLERPRDLFLKETKRPFIGLISAKISGNNEFDFWKTYYYNQINSLNNERLKIKFKELLDSLG